MIIGADSASTYVANCVILQRVQSEELSYPRGEMLTLLIRVGRIAPCFQSIHSHRRLYSPVRLLAPTRAASINALRHQISNRIGVESRFRRRADILLTREHS